MKKLLIITSILFLAASCAKPLSRNVFKTQEECEKATGKTCQFWTCDVVPEGKKFEDVCPNGSKFWSPIENSTSTPDKLPQGDKTGWNTYTNSQSGFSIQYPSTFSVYTDINKAKPLSYIPVCDETMVTCLVYKYNSQEKTNLDGAAVSVNVDSKLDSEAKCYNFADQYSETQTAGADVNINGVIFKSATGGGGAAGHYDKVTVYRNFYNGKCYEIAQHIAATNIGVYSPGTVKEFNENEVSNALKQVASTFKFTGSSDSTQKPSSDTVTVIGTTICLPHKNPGEMQTMECAIGLREDGTGKNYSLELLGSNFFDTNIKVKVVGKLVDDSNSNYAVVGKIKNSVITTLAGINDSVTLQKGQSAIVDGATLTLADFYYHPCPEGSQCIWSGLDVFYTLTVNGKTYNHLSVGQRDESPYSVVIKDSDYKTYATFVLSKNK